MRDRANEPRVDVLGVVLRRVVLHHPMDAIQIEPARRDVGAKQHACGEAPSSSEAKLVRKGQWHDRW